ncbi:MAG: aldo/keto reductase [Bacteroidota bacterium]
MHLLVHGVSIPKLGLGTYKLTGADGTRGVEHALDLGYRHIDTAQIYRNEAEVGRGLAQSPVDREAVFLTTKVWHDKLAHADVIASTEESLRKLGTDYVDLLLIHWPNDAVDLAETLDAFQQLRADGKARLIGVSNFPPGMLRRALEIVPDLATNQVEYHPYLDQSALLDIADTHALSLTSYSPLAQGQLFQDNTLAEIAGAHGKSVAQVVLRWHLQQERVFAIPKASSDTHRAGNFDVFDFALSDDEMQRIHDLARPDGRIVDPGFGPDWDA